jgi:hypothetical protein
MQPPSGPPDDALLPLRDCLLGQFDLGWQLAAHHLDGLDMASCLWRPAPRGLHVVAAADGWMGEWPASEGYDLGPASIGWLGWHMGYWLSMAIDHNFGDGRLDRHGVVMPGDAAALHRWLTELGASWRAAVAALPPTEWRSPTRARWPFQGRAFADIAAWANIELMKSAAEIGYVRFLHAGREISPSCG